MQQTAVLHLNLWNLPQRRYSPAKQHISEIHLIGYASYFNKIEHPFQINLDCSIKLFRIYIKTASATLSLVPSTWEREDIIRLVTCVKRSTDMTSLTCAGSAMVGIFSKGWLRIHACYIHEIISVSRQKMAYCCHINFFTIYQNALILQWKSTLFLTAIVGGDCPWFLVSHYSNDISTCKCFSAF